MTMVQTRHFRFSEALDDCKNCSVYESDVIVGVAIADLPDPVVVRRLKVLHPIRANSDIVKQRDEYARV